MATVDEVLTAALALGCAERAEVAHELLLSLEPTDFDQEVDRVWADEIRRRLRAIREGRVVLRDWDEALLDIRQSLANGSK